MSNCVSCINEWSDAVKLADSTPRLSLADPISKLQEVRRKAADLDYPMCAWPIQQKLLDLMDKGIDAYLAFMAQRPDSEVQGLFDEAMNSFEEFGLEFSDLMWGYEPYGPQPRPTPTAGDSGAIPYSLSTITAWNAADLREVARWGGQSIEAHSVAFYPTASHTAVGLSSGKVLIWDLQTGDQYELSGQEGSVQGVAFSPDGSWLASVSSDGSLWIWDANPLRTNQGTVEPVGDTEGYSLGYWSVAFSADSNLLAAGTAEGTVYLWDMSTGQQVNALEEHTGAVRGLSFLSNLLASASEDGTVRLWVMDTQEELLVLSEHKAPLTSVALSPRGDFLAAGGQDSSVRLWVVGTSWDSWVLEGHAGPVQSVVFSPDGNLLASASADGTVRIWDLRTNEQVGLLQGHGSSVLSVAFSSDGNLIATSSADGTVRLWGVPRP